VVTAFLGTALAGLRPRRRREALLQGLVLLSPPVLLAIVRANNDLVVFAVLGAGLLIVRTLTPWRLAVIIAGVAVATGLKFYPAVAAHVWTDFGRAVIPMPSSVDTFGAGLMLGDLGWSARSVAVVAVLLTLVLGLFFYRRGLTRGLAGPEENLPDRMRFPIASALLLVCFLAGISYAYRWVFALWLVPWIWREATGPAATLRRIGGRLALGLLLFAI
jgi:hypothetical protein